VSTEESPVAPASESTLPSEERTGAALPRQLMRAIRHDPHHFPEHLVLIAQERLADPSAAWARRTRLEQPHASISQLTERTRTGAAHLARTDGALAGTPFLIALVPAYVSVLWEQARMVMRIAALSGRDPRDDSFAAELLSLRGLYETPALALEGLSQLASGRRGDNGGLRGRLIAWVRLVYRILILAGFVSAPARGEAKAGRSWAGRGLTWLLAAGLFVITWVIPVTFMLAMSWSCETDTRTLGDRAIRFYGEAPAQTLARAEPREGNRSLVHVVALVLSLGIPLGLVAVAVAEPVAHAHLVAIAGFVGLAVVLALGARASRR
jgi:hypothetical protein